jgi:hypothetical protein
MLILGRHRSNPARFSSRNRHSLLASSALEQAGGMLAAPIVIVAVCSLLTTDLTDVVLPAVLANLAWIAGYATVPIVLTRVRRRLPLTLTIGAAIVRAASLALLAYVLAGDDVTREQRLRSILICVVAYSVAAGLARGASEALGARTTVARHARRSDTLMALFPTTLALLVGLGSFTLLVDVPRSPLSRLSTLFGVAAGFSAAAALILGLIGESPNMSVADPRSRLRFTGWRKQTRSVSWLVGSAICGRPSCFLIVGLVRYMELPRAYLLSGLGAFLAASAVTAVVGDWLDGAVPFRALIQAPAVLSGAAFAIAIGLPDPPEHRPCSGVSVWSAAGGGLGLACYDHGRRRPAGASPGPSPG